MKNVIHPQRFTAAVTKLYTAYHSGELDANECTHCAVGNILDNTISWRLYFGHKVGLNRKKEIILVHPVDSGNKHLFFGNGYNGEELHQVETLFMNQFIGFHSDDKNAQFNGLCAVVEYLCELDGIPNVMDYTKLFETEHNKPKYNLI